MNHNHKISLKQLLEVLLCMLAEERLAERGGTHWSYLRCVCVCVCVCVWVRLWSSCRGWAAGVSSWCGGSRCAVITVDEGGVAVMSTERGRMDGWVDGDRQAEERERQWGRERHKKSEWMYGCTSMWARETKYQNNERKEDVWEDV